MFTEVLQERYASILRVKHSSIYLHLNYTVKKHLEEIYAYIWRS
jgi:hypothetical protein